VPCEVIQLILTVLSDRPRTADPHRLAQGLGWQLGGAAVV